MAKDFKRKIGSKRLNTLIPDTEPEVISTTSSSTATLQEPTENKSTEQKIEPAQAPPPPETVVSTFRINTEKLMKMKAIAFWDRKKIQDVFDEALEMYIDAQPEATVKKAVTEYTKRTT